MACSDRVMPRNGRIEALQVGHPQACLRDGPCGNFSEKLEVVRVDFLKDGHSAGGSNKINAPGSVVILQVVGAAYAIQSLNNFSRLRIDDSEPARFMLVSAPNVSCMRFQPAAYKQTMMNGVDARSVGYRTIRDWPLRDHGAFFQINDRNVTFAIHNISHGHVQTLSRWLDCDARRIAAGQLNAAYQLGRFGINDIDGRVVGSMITTAAKVFEDFDASINQMRGWIVRAVIRAPVGIAKSRQFHGLGDLVGRAADGDDTAVCQF